MAGDNLGGAELRARSGGKVAVLGVVLASWWALQRGPHSQGLPDWQPQAQVAGVAAWVRQPQVQDAPTQGLHAQRDVSMFMARLRLVDGWASAHVANFARRSPPGLERSG